MYKKAHATIRENPVHEKKPPKEVKKKRWEILTSEADLFWTNLAQKLWYTFGKKEKQPANANCACLVS